jgi:hypothetical protein
LDKIGASVRKLEFASDNSPEEESQ